jgi:PAS domain S-box-containing protein
MARAFLTSAAHSFAPPSLFAASYQFWPSVFFLLIGVLASISATVLYVGRLNRLHRRLLSALETQLAQRRRIEDALRESEGFYHSLVEHLPQSILRKDREGRFTFGNKKVCASLGLTLEEIVGRTDDDFFPAPLAEKYRADDQRVIDSGEVLQTIEEHVTPQGDTLYVHTVKTPLRDPNGKIIGVQCIFFDVTDRRRYEEQLRAQNIRLQQMAESEHRAHSELKQAQSRLVQSEKLASLGQMVAGVAHEINNPVAFVTNNVAVLQRDVAEIEALLGLYQEAEDVIARERADIHHKIVELRERVDMQYTIENIQGLLLRSRDGLKRIQEIVGHLRAFAHLDEGEVNEADLNQGIESTTAIIIGHAKKKQVRLDLELEPLPPLTCYAAKLNQVVMNLMSNAIDACDEGGSVTVHTHAEPGQICIEVSDDGHGIPPEVRDRIFDPFFTTKPVGQGTGLGLSISYGIVHDHGGTIDVDSAPGRGTRFTVRLPTRRERSAGETKGVRATGEAAAPAVAGRQPGTTAR